MIDIDSNTATASPTAAICESLALYGASPERGELDSREVWDEDDATEALAEAVRIMVDGITVDGTQLADEREALLWSLVNCFHAQVARLDRSVDRIVPEMKRPRDRPGRHRGEGVGVAAPDRSRPATSATAGTPSRRCAMSPLTTYRAETGDVWRPRHGSHTSRTGALTSAAIDARDFRRARKDRETRAHLPEGTLVAVTGGKEVADHNAVWSTLDRTHAKHGDMVLLHGGGPGIETVAAKWAEARGVHQLIVRPDWKAHGKAAPFRRNDELLNLLPKGVIAFPGSGITGNLVDKARQLGIPCTAPSHEAALPFPAGAGPRHGEDRLLLFAPCPMTRIAARR